MKKGVIGVLSLLTGIVGGVVGVKKIERSKSDQIRQSSDKYMALFRMMNQWVRIKQEGKNLSSYFKENGYKNIAVYGMSYAGESLVEELKETEIHVAYGIDRNADHLYADINIVSIEEMTEVVDVIVVTAITYYEEIEKKLSEMVNCPIISLEDILCEMME